MKYLTDNDLSLNAKDLDRDSADPKTYNVTETLLVNKLYLTRADTKKEIQQQKHLRR